MPIVLNGEAETSTKVGDAVMVVPTICKFESDLFRKFVQHFEIMKFVC